MEKQANASNRVLDARLIDKAWKDEAFRQALLADPKGTVERELGVSLPEGFTVTVVEETPDSYHLVLPHGRTHRTGELSDAELEAAAGGDAYCCTLAYGDCE